MSTTSPRPGSVTGAGRAPGAGVARIEEREITLHAQHITYRESGADSGGPVVVLLHGLAGSSSTWLPVMSLLGAHAHVIAPDLLGHGLSAKPHDGDYSLGAYAAGLRDLIVALGLDRATVVGHSFGGGVAMQFAYQFPELVERLVLVASGGFGREVAPALRAASLPGTALALGTVTRLTPRWVGKLLHRTARAVPGISRPEVDEVAQSITALADPGARDAFVHTVRNTLDLGGQRLNGLERLRLVSDAPLLLIAGRKDLCIPTEHTTRAHDACPASRLELFPSAGHFPHRDQPLRFAQVVLDFLATTTASHTDLQDVRRRLRDTSDTATTTAA
jgi:pimeloyl-ACP methyl ester carboxylesterase